jgi:ethylmalonyl-CoA mutase
VIVGGIIPEPDAATLRELGVARVFTPKNFEITAMLAQIVEAVEAARG